MTEQNDQLERDLANMRPRALGPELIGRIESAIAASSVRRWADRLLVCAMGAGSLAACVIVGILTMSGHTPVPRPSPAQTIAQVPSIGSYTRALARADNDWIDLAK
ncbi:MAG: hypothetical protein ABSH08_04995 [Tepidisphaeraceae bacterium]|jgi:hypothetical protein